MHLAPEFGETFREIEKDGFTVDYKVEMLLSSDTPVGVTKSIGLGMIGFGDALRQLQPHLLVVLGDRFEILPAVTAALIMRIPVAHIHGGEVTEGAFDEAIRHSITKMSHLHFVAAEDHRERVIQLGEDPDRVFVVGVLGIDSIENLELLDRESLEASLGFKLGVRNLLVTFHPATLEIETAVSQLSELLAALETLDDTHLIFTMPNADTEGRALRLLIQRFVDDHAHARAYTSLGQHLYLSCMRHVDAVVGNSSSGLIEAPAFRKGTINIGDRQRGRLKAESVIDCAANRVSIQEALRRLYEPDFQAKLAVVKNPYGRGGAGKEIVRLIRELSLEGILGKAFHDLPAASGSNGPAGARRT
jgi:GDP/UDP-N,N'-diacetylbacillosamine 2-epimerase (hydrolysing)